MLTHEERVKNLKERIRFNDQKIQRYERNELKAKSKPKKSLLKKGMKVIEHTTDISGDGRSFGIVSENLRGRPYVQPIA